MYGTVVLVIFAVLGMAHILQGMLTVKWLKLDFQIVLVLAFVIPTGNLFAILFIICPVRLYLLLTH